MLIFGSTDMTEAWGVRVVHLDFDRPDVGDDMLRFAMMDNAGSGGGPKLERWRKEEGVGLKYILRRRKEYLFTWPAACIREGETKPVVASVNFFFCV
jgi:hypothetical protein